MNGLEKTHKRIHLFKDFLFLLLVVLLIIQFIACKSRVPSSSMEPTVMPGDRIIFNKIGAYYREPERGEIVIFEEDRKQLIKRLIGLPGETIELIDGKAYIDGVELIETAYLGDEVMTLPVYDPNYESIKYPYTVPEDSYFFLGDNRSRSLDSRVFGGIKKEAVVAIGAYRIYPFDRMGSIK